MVKWNKRWDFCKFDFFNFDIISKEFKKIFRLAFPERPEDKLDLLTAKVANVEKTDGKIRKYCEPLT